MVYDVAIVGAGIHGSALLLNLIRFARIPAASIVVIDPHPAPLNEWQLRARNCTMQYVRSPASHSLDAQLNGLRRWARAQNREQFAPPYHRPAVTLFNEHSAALLQRYTAQTPRVRAYAHMVRSAVHGFEVDLESVEPESVELKPKEQGSAEPGRIPVVVRARRVVLAVGNPAPYLHPTARGEDTRVMHVYDPAFDPNAVPKFARVVVVGGGIAASHLCLNLSGAPWNARVTQLVRRAPPVSLYDSDPCYIGPGCAPRFAAIADYTQRRALIDDVRARGSVPPGLAEELDLALNRKQFQRYLTCPRSVRSAGRALHVEDERGLVHEADRVIFATGFAAGPPQPQLVARIGDSLQAPLAACGFPVPNAALEWVPGLYLSGALAELEIGPPARNIIGAHLASRRIVSHLSGRRFGPARSGAPALR